MSTVRFLMALSVGAACLALAPPANADPPSSPSSKKKDPKAEAMDRFKRAVDLYEEGDYAGSLIEFRRAYDLAPSYKLLYKIGQVSYKLKDYAGALKAFEQYVADGGDKIPARNRAEVEEEINLLKSRTGQIQVVTNVPGAQVFIDDVVVGTTPLDEPVLVSIGKRKIHVTAEGRAPVTRVVNVAGREAKRVDVPLQKIRGDRRRPRTVKKDEDSPSKWTTWSWVGVGTSAALGIGATVTGLVATSASKDLEEMTYSGDKPSNSIETQQSKVKGFALATDILAGAAIVTLGTTLYLTFSRSDPAPEADQKTTKARVEPVLGIDMVGVQGAF